MEEKEPPENIDFLNDTVDPSYAPKKRTDSKDMGDFANLLDPQTKPPTKKKAKEDILNLDFGSSSKPKPGKSKPQTEHEKQIDAQEKKLTFANEIDPQVKQWSQDPSTGTVKDIRSLLISLKGFLDKFNVKFDQISLSQVMSKGAVRKMYFKVIRKIHPDKTSETEPRILYMLQRISEIVTKAFNKHKSMAQ